jgi:hypothetical protein
VQALLRKQQQRNRATGPAAGDEEDKAWFVTVIGIQPTEYDGMTQLERAAYVDAWNDKQDALAGKPKQGKGKKQISKDVSDK